MTLSFGILKVAYLETNLLSALRAGVESVDRSRHSIQEHVVKLDVIESVRSINPGDIHGL